MTTIQCKAVLFDLDGVLVDSTPAVARVWTIWANKHGFDPEETVRRAHGRPSLATIRDLLPNADHAAENSFVERMEIEDVEGVIALPGAVELLQTLPANGWTIVTSCTRPLALVRLRVAGLPIPTRLVTSNDIVNGKPDPEPYRKGAELLGIAAADCTARWCRAGPHCDGTSLSSAGHPACIARTWIRWKRQPAQRVPEPDAYSDAIPAGADSCAVA